MADDEMRERVRAVIRRGYRCEQCGAPAASTALGSGGWLVLCRAHLRERMAAADTGDE